MNGKRIALVAAALGIVVAIFWSKEPPVIPVTQEPVVIQPGNEGAVVYCLVEDKLRSGESLYDLLIRHDLAPRAALAVGDALGKEILPKHLWSSDRFKLVFDESGGLVSLEIQRGALTRFRLDANGDRFDARTITVPVDTVAQAVWGRLNNSLWADFTGAGAPPAIIVAFTEVFAWSVDFFREAQPGDGFGVYFDEIRHNGQLVGTGDIAAAFYVNWGDTLWAFSFGEGKALKYFDAKGKSLKKSLLRAPLKFSRVSSSFSRRRLHPVYKTVRPHNGVDYVASSGTPVYAAGDGIAQFVGRKSGLGKCVEIRHPNGYRTVYGHLRGFAKGVSSGDRVKQGQNIGYVGQTGNASGPHLHYEVRLGNKPVNPRTLKLPAKGPIPSADRDAFEVRRDILIRKLTPPYGPMLARAH